MSKTINAFDVTAPCAHTAIHELTEDELIAQAREMLRSKAGNEAVSERRVAETQFLLSSGRVKTNDDLMKFGITPADLLAWFDSVEAETKRLSAESECIRAETESAHAEIQRIMAEHEPQIQTAERLLAGMAGEVELLADEEGEFVLDHDGSKIYRHQRFPQLVLAEAVDRFEARSYGVQ